MIAESYDFHGCELLQSVVENRSRGGGNGGGLGLVSVQLVEGEVRRSGQSRFHTSLEGVFRVIKRNMKGQGF